VQDLYQTRVTSSPKKVGLGGGYCSERNIPRGCSQCHRKATNLFLRSIFAVPQASDSGCDGQSRLTPVEASP
ncbi:hypothetical protein SK128_003600, partial [Halocaridina rubra]